jgi:lysophospholipase L1-like esterase
MNKPKQFIRILLFLISCLFLKAGWLGAAQSSAPRFADEIQAFEEADKKSFPPSGGVLFVGSSSIRLWKTLAEDFPRRPVINRGFGGAFISEVLYYADRIILPYKPRLIVLFIGGNDIAEGRTPEEVVETLIVLTDLIHEKLPHTRLAYVSINPTIARWHLDDQIRKTNQLVREYVDEQEWMVFIDSYSKMLSPEGKPRPELLSEDQLHLSSQGYRLWKSIIEPYLKP